ncbi:MAG TPA: AAA family ATPase [Segeticoccus sp.]|uniref:HelD family protein n=1 Tax=Segeticoccus sp. TaxID=2706531 RepID=UPI002D80785B|nr:AAA family ATPase [Segeticoccus sp.]HET8600489.1 AAA family ATPase [Segeticoccus sp.]
MPADTAPDTDPELAREQAHLALARRELARMREHTLALESHGGDPVSSEFLAATLARRARSLQDDPSTALFFGRLDIRPDGHAGTRMRADPAPDGEERWYIGRRHVSDAHGDPVVVDWRAGISTAFYRASRTEPMGVRRRRRFGIDHGRVTAYEDEHLTEPEAGQANEPDSASSRIVAAEIERPRVGPMRDIVATIQPEQDEIVRADVATTICVQGAPGTGKTAVGLHRAAWLLYSFREKLARTGVLVIGPNRAFLEHIGAVLPALGEVSVDHTTIEELVGSVRVRATDPVDTAVLKGDPRMAEVLRRAVWAHVGDPHEALVVPRGARKWRVPAYEVREIVRELVGRGVRYDAARAMLPQRLAHAVLLQLEASGDSPDDRVQDAVARSGPVKRYVAGLWPALEPAAVLFELFTQPATLARHADGILDAGEQALLVWPTVPRTRGSARWSVQDTVLLDELADLLRRRSSVGHVVLDEAQDLSPMQLRAVGRRCSTGSATVLGDIAQGTTPWATASWTDSLAHLGKPASHLEVLDRGFRVPAAVIDFAARLLPSMAPGLGAPVSVRENPGRLLLRHAPRALARHVVEAVTDALEQPGSVGVIAADAQVGRLSRALTEAGVDHGILGAQHGDVEHRVDLVPATVAKGLEFDHVVVVEPAAIAAAEPDRRTGLRRLYVVLTRAVSALTVVHAEDLPEQLAA